MAITGAAYSRNGQTIYHNRPITGGTEMITTEENRGAVLIAYFAFTVYGFALGVIVGVLI
jgi:hypothetical protein